MRVAGFGFRASATEQALFEALRALGGAEGLGGIATAVDKAEAAAIRGLGARLRLPVMAVALEDLARAEAGLSGAVPERYGRRSVAEAAALVAAGPGARLVARRVVSACGTATCAIAEAGRG